MQPLQYYLEDYSSNEIKHQPKHVVQHQENIKNQQEYQHTKEYFVSKQFSVFEKHILRRLLFNQKKI